MRIAILNYPRGVVEIIENAPHMDSNEKVEEWLVKHGYRMKDIYYMTDCCINFVTIE